MGPIIPDGNFTCAMCGGCFEFGCSLEEEQAEAERDFGDMPDEEMVRICDDCYQLVRPDANPHEYTLWRQNNASRNN
jgi:hypothetical protein